MDFFQPLLRASFWFAPAAIPFSPWIGTTILIVMSALTVIGIGCVVYRSYAKGLDKGTRKLLARYASFALTMSAIGFFLYFVTWQGIPFLSMRFWFVIWGILLVVWLVPILLFQFKTLPAERAQTQARSVNDKWLPKPKK